MFEWQLSTGCEVFSMLVLGRIRLSSAAVLYVSQALENELVKHLV